MLKRILTAVTAIFLSTPVLAWSDGGHKQTADIAWTQLKPSVRQKLKVILMKGDPHFRPADESDDEVRKAFVLAATFPDYIKGKRDTIYEAQIQELNKKWLPILDPNNREHELCKTWHYFDWPIRVPEGKKIEPVSSSNALQALAFGELQLADSNLDDRQRCWWLYWIEHIVGDLHQPLHCVSSYEHEPRGDDGGNKFKVRLDGKEKGLHGLWDNAIDRAAASEQMSTQKPAQVTDAWLKQDDFLPSEEAVKIVDPSDWVQEGVVLSESTVYEGLTPGADFTPEYDRRCQELCKRRALLGGFRLARILNRLLN